MNSFWIAGTSFICAFGGGLAGMEIGRRMPPAQLTAETRKVVQLITGLVATMAALVLSLLINGAKATFDAQSVGLQQMGANIILLDRTLAHYGDETKAARADLHDEVQAMIDYVWGQNGPRQGALADATITAKGGALLKAILELNPTDDAHRGMQARALQLSAEIARTRWQLIQQSRDSLPVAFLVVLHFWFIALFISFGLLGARNATVVVTLLVGAVTLASAMLLLVDLDQPFEGLIQASREHVRGALDQLGN